ncbi:hypothetical protein CTAYLR_010194 [Chrysophaeum taylorii]|uniref:Uncharacterized protein n=1 Tax=Chrysophaeum taylorii TaxID=2483200 RepID=A0AAD7UE89_9STRA|nr:hypothetical protein CTAYLR_010194 [Chrysophaeum taylorii]
MDDGDHRGKQLWRSLGVAVVLPADVMQDVRRTKPDCSEAVLFAIREAMVHSFAASRCIALFSVPDQRRPDARRLEPRPIGVDSAGFFYSSPDDEPASLSVAALSEAPPYAAQVATMPLTKGERLLVVYAPKAARDNPSLVTREVNLLPSGPEGEPSFLRATVRAVSEDESRFWYDVDPLEHPRHTLLETKGSAIFRQGGDGRVDLVGLRLCAARADPQKARRSSGHWTHEAVSAVSLVRQVRAFARDEATALQRRADQAVRDDERITDGGLKLLRTKLRSELAAYLATRGGGGDNEEEPEKKAPLPLNIQMLDGGAAFAASCAALAGIEALLPLAIDFYAANEPEGAAKVFFQVAALASTPGAAGLNAATRASARPAFVCALRGAVRGGVPHAAKDESPTQLKAHILRNNLAAAAAEAIAALARRVDANGLRALGDARVPLDVVVSIRHLATIARADGSLVGVVRWLWGALRAAAALCRAKVLRAQLRDADLVSVLDDIIDDIRALARRGRALDLDVTDGLAVWTKVRDACCDDESPATGRRTRYGSASRLAPKNEVPVNELAKFLDVEGFHQRNLRAPLPLDKFENTDEYLALRAKYARVEDESERPSPRALPQDELGALISAELEAANAAHMSSPTPPDDDDASRLPPGGKGKDVSKKKKKKKNSSVRVETDRLRTTQVERAKTRAQLPCPDVAGARLRRRIFTPKNMAAALLKP